MFDIYKLRIKIFRYNDNKSVFFDSNLKGT